MWEGRDKPPSRTHLRTSAHQHAYHPPRDVEQRVGKNVACPRSHSFNRAAHCGAPRLRLKSQQSAHSQTRLPTSLQHTPAESRCQWRGGRAQLSEQKRGACVKKQQARC
ncbi:hypothetical protein TcCL_ESM11074, partial [Trypanosoma cruzi]